MAARDGIDRLNEESLAAFTGRAADGPVFMLNLIEFLPEGGAERYAEYGAAIAPVLEKAGGEPVFAGRPGENLIGEGNWDLVLVVRYPTRQAFLDMIFSSEYREIAHLRTEALARAELRALDSIEAAVG